MASFQEKEIRFIFNTLHSTAVTCDILSIETYDSPSGIAPDVESGPVKNLNLLSLDAGGPQGISQLMILKDIMESISRDSRDDSGVAVKRPCEVFHAIGGVGTGGFIAILLVVLKLTAEEALKEFSVLVGLVFKEVVSDPKKQTEKLKHAIELILERHGVAKFTDLIPSSPPTPACRLIVPIVYKDHVGAPCVLRNYVAGHEPPTNLTIAEAMLATCATPPIFTPTSIKKDFITFEFVGGDVGQRNPTREIIAESYRAFGGDSTVACLLSIGSGHTSVIGFPQDSNAVAWVGFLDRVTKDGEKTAQEIAAQMKHLTLYHRLSVDCGLDSLKSDSWNDLTVITTAVMVYLNDLEASERVKRCVDTINHGDGFATLEQLRHSGGTKFPSPAMPPLTPHYVERKQATRFVENALFGRHGSIKSGSKIIVVTGIGGCGKTQLIRKFIDRHGEKFVTAFFADGSSKGAFQRDLVRYVRSLGGGNSQKTFDESMQLLSQPILDGERILIIDNVDDPGIDLAPFLPRWPNGTVIITSRDRSRGQLGSSHLELDVMSEDEAVELLVRGSGRVWPPSDLDHDATVAVARELGCHPIALVQAISYMSNTGYSADRYITQLRSHREPLLNDPATNQVEIRYKTAFAAFDASYEILPPQAQKALHLLSCFHWQNFCLDLVSLAAEDDFSTEYYNYMPRGEEFELGKECLASIFCPSGQWNPLKLDSLVRSLQNHSLITVVTTKNVTLLQMHPLVHEWSRSRLPINELENFRGAAIRLLCCGANGDRHYMIQYLYHHLQALSSDWDTLHMNDALAFAFILHECGLYSKAVKLREAGCKQLRVQLGGDHLYTITASANLANTYHQLGRYGEAEEMETEVLQQRGLLLGVDHPDTIMASASLTETYREMGRYADAERLDKAMLKQTKQRLGENHPETIRASGNLAVTYRDVGRYSEAEELEVEVLRRRRELLGADHPDTILASANLAGTYRDLGRYGEAEKLEKEVILRRRAVLGVDHPDTILASGNLAVTYCQLGRYRDAEELEVEVLRRRGEVLGVDHPDTILASANLAATYSRLGRYSHAEELQKEVLWKRSALLGVDHPNTIRASGNLATTYRNLRRYSEAEELEKDVLRRRREVLGADHPETLVASANLAATYCRLRRYQAAEELGREVLQRSAAILGADHPNTISASANLAVTYRALRQYGDAERLQKSVLSQRSAILGQRHPATLCAMYNLARTYDALQRRYEAIELAKNATQMLLETLGETHPLYLKTSTFLVNLTKAPPVQLRRRDRALAYVKRGFSSRLFSRLSRSLILVR